MLTGRIKQGYGIIQRDIMRLKISIYSKAVYCLLVSYAGNKEQCFPSLKTMCDDLDISKTTLIKSLKELISIKLLIADKSKTKSGDYANNIYYPMYLMDSEVVQEVNYGNTSDAPPVVQEVNTKNNTRKKSNLRTDTKVSELALFPDLVISEKKVSISDRCKKFIELFNSTRLVDGEKSGFKDTKSVCGKLRERLKNYESSDIIKALKVAISDKYHIDNKFKYITPQYILREDIIERYLNQSKEQIQSELTGENNQQSQGARL